MEKSKFEWLSIFRSKGDKLFMTINNTPENRIKAHEINLGIKEYRESIIRNILEYAHKHNWSNEKRLNELMKITYASYISMLEYRNKVWPYEYMAFARRIGELWEPFCKLPFYFPVNRLELIDAPNFDNVQENIKQSAIQFIDSLNIEVAEKEKLKKIYDIPWTMVDSGGIKLELDLHFVQNGIYYNCDFKSGFSSNEKGNTNRLLLVASIYRSLGDNERTILFVRQKEYENNHYLQTLKKSNLWEVYCSDSCYRQIKYFTGFDIRAWLDTNAIWEKDISEELKQHLIAEDLLKYLTW